MKRALAERAKSQSSSLPTKNVAAAAEQAAKSSPPTATNLTTNDSPAVLVGGKHSPSSPDVQPPMKIPRLHKQTAASSAHASTTLLQETTGGAGAPSSSSSLLSSNHHNRHLAGAGNDSTAVSSTTNTGRSHHQHHHQQQQESSSRGGEAHQQHHRHSNIDTPSAQAAASAAARSSNKRQRSHRNHVREQDNDDDEEDEEEDEETKASGFYLKHQNRALATELSSLQAAVSELSAERDYRRRTCLEAVQALHSLQATWTSLEAAMLGSQPQQSQLPTSSAVAAASSSGTNVPDPRAPASTAGSTPETAVEWTVALQDSLQALASSQGDDSTAPTIKHSSTTSRQEVQNQQTPPDPSMADLGRLAANVASRANCLQEWIWKVLQATPEQQREMGKSLSSSANANKHDDTAGDSTAPKNENDVEFWKQSCQRMETQVLELTHARDQVAQRERRLRRNVYRLSAGMMTQEQVLQQALNSVEGGEGQEEFLAVTAAAAAASNATNHGTSAATTTTTATTAAAPAANGGGSHQNADAEKSHGSLPSVSSLPIIKNEQGTDGAVQSESSLLPQQDGSSSSAAAMEIVPSAVASADGVGAAAADGSGGSMVSSTVVDEMKLQLQTMEQQVLQGEKAIHELNATLQERELRINQLSMKQQSEEDAQRLQLLEVTTCKLDAANKKVAELQDKLNLLKTEWAQSAGNDQTLRETMKDMQDKHHNRWSELTTIWTALSSAEPISTTGEEESNKNSSDAQQQESINGEAPTGTATTSSADTGDDDLAQTATTAAEAASVGAQKQERKIVELEHKLSQALENVRQAETARSNLKTALSMNTTLQGKLDDLKHKYAAAVAAAAEQRGSGGNHGTSNPSSRSASTNESSATASNSGGGGSSTPRERESSSSSTAAAAATSSSSSTHDRMSAERVEKLYRDNKKMKKEISAIMASKEAHKAKIERIEKERDGLMDANARLLQQITEKDEMNAKSLSTILHLKSMAEHLKTERDNLEQQVKSASQLALASRLASNAKDRVSEEMLKEKNSIQENLTELETTHEATKEELNRITLEWSQADGKAAAVRSELDNALKRCDELVSQVEEKRQEIHKLVTSLDKAEQEAREANKKLAESAAAAATSNAGAKGSGRRLSGASGGSAGDSNFTVEQLNTQISFLKGRLACPVCHYRDKQCIIMRCRHMHCKQCVEEQISNRSRKCPSCNGKFSEKDVEDIWLD